MNKKHFRINQLLLQVNDLLIDKFFDNESNEMLDLKIEVLTKLANGEQVNREDYYKILELYPHGEMWD